MNELNNLMKKQTFLHKIKNKDPTLGYLWETSFRVKDIDFK